MTATAPHLSLVPDLDPVDEAPAPLERGTLDQVGAAAPARPTEDRDGRPLATPHTEALGPDWAALRSFTAVAGTLLGAFGIGAVSGGPEEAVTCGLAGLAVVYVAGHITGRG